MRKKREGPRDRGTIINKAEFIGLRKEWRKNCLRGDWDLKIAGQESGEKKTTALW